MKADSGYQDSEKSDGSYQSDNSNEVFCFCFTHMATPSFEFYEQIVPSTNVNYTMRVKCLAQENIM